jgi:hypothetical protein
MSQKLGFVEEFMLSGVAAGVSKVNKKSKILKPEKCWLIKRTISQTFREH